MPTDRELIDALCVSEIGWRSENEGKRFRAAQDLLRTYVGRMRTREQEDAILAEAEAIRMRRAAPPG